MRGEIVNETQEIKHSSNVWTKKVLMCFIILSLVHLFVLTLNYHFYDWIVEWRAITDLTNGISFYEQDSYYIKELDLITGVPNHLPVFFYAAAFFIMIFGSEQFWGRIFLWIFTLILAFLVLKLAEPNTEKKALLQIILIFCNPTLLNINYFGMFDQFACVILLSGIIFVLRDRPFIAGLFIGLGTMTKLFPVMLLVTGGIYYLKKREYFSFVKLSISSCVTIISILSFFIFTIGERFIEQSILYQLERGLSTNPWDLTIRRYLNFSNQLYLIFLVQLSLFMIGYIYLKKGRNINPCFLLVTSSSLIALLILFLKTVFPHYFLWFMVLQIPLISLSDKDYKMISLIILSIGLIFLGNFLINLLVINPIFHIFAVMSTNLGLLVVIILPFYYLRLKEATTPEL